MSGLMTRAVEVDIEESIRAFAHSGRRAMLEVFAEHERSEGDGGDRQRMTPRRGTDNGALIADSAGVTTDLAPPGLASFAHGQGSDDERSDWVGPPPAERRVRDQADEQDRG